MAQAETRPAAASDARSRRARTEKLSYDRKLWIAPAGVHESRIIVVLGLARTS